MWRRKAPSTGARQPCMTIDPRSLDPGEQLLWTDRPIIDAYCRRKGQDGFLASCQALPLVLVLLAFGTVLAGFGITHGGTAIFGVGLALVLFALAALYLPVRVRRDARRTSFAITDRRAIIETPGLLLRNRISVPCSEIQTIEVRDGVSDDVLFRDHEVKSEHGSHFERDGFLAIKDASKVSRLLRSTVENCIRSPSPGPSA